MRQKVASLTLGALLIAVPLSAAEKVGAHPEPSAEQESRIERMTTMSSVSNAPTPVGVEHDVYCTGWIADENDLYSGTIVSAEKVDSQKAYIEGDILYLDIGAAQGVAAGQELWIVRQDRLIYRYGSVLDVLGRLIESEGRLRILCAQENASIAEIVLSCNDVVVGDQVLPFEPIPIPLVRRSRPKTSCDTPNGKVSGHVIQVKDRAIPAATDSIVYLDLGEGDGLAPGDFLTVFRTRHIRSREEYGSMTGGYLRVDEGSGVDVDSVRTILGEVAVLVTRPQTSVAKITWMHDIMTTGDEVEAK